MGWRDDAIALDEPQQQTWRQEAIPLDAPAEQTVMEPQSPAGMARMRAGFEEEQQYEVDQENRRRRDTVTEYQNALVDVADYDAYKKRRLSEMDQQSAAAQKEGRWSDYTATRQKRHRFETAGDEDPDARQRRLSRAADALAKLTGDGTPRLQAERVRRLAPQYSEQKKLAAELAAEEARVADWLKQRDEIAQGTPGVSTNKETTALWAKNFREGQARQLKALDEGPLANYRRLTKALQHSRESGEHYAEVDAADVAGLAELEKQQDQWLAEHPDAAGLPRSLSWALRGEKGKAYIRRDEQRKRLGEWAMRANPAAAAARFERELGNDKNAIARRLTQHAQENPAPASFLDDVGRRYLEEQGIDPKDSRWQQVPTFGESVTTGGATAGAQMQRYGASAIDMAVNAKRWYQGMGYDEKGHYVGGTEKLPLSDLDKAARERAAAIRENARQVQEAVLRHPRSNDPTHISFYLEQLPSTFLQYAPTVVAALTTGGAGAAASGWFMEAGGAYEETMDILRGQGIEGEQAHQTAMAVSTIVGTINSGLEATGAMGGVKGASKSLAMRVLGAMASEGGTETVQALVNEITYNMATGKPIDWTQPLIEGWLGAITGGTVGLAGGVSEKLAQRFGWEAAQSTVPMTQELAQTIADAPPAALEKIIGDQSGMYSDDAKELAGEVLKLRVAEFQQVQEAQFQEEQEKQAARERVRGATDEDLKNVAAPGNPYISEMERELAAEELKRREAAKAAQATGKEQAVDSTPSPGQSSPPVAEQIGAGRTSPPEEAPQRPSGTIEQAAAEVRALSKAWHDGPDAVQNREAFDANLHRLIQAEQGMVQFIPEMTTPERALVSGVASAWMKSPWFESLPEADQTFVRALTPSEGSDTKLAELIRAGAEDADLLEQIGKILQTQGGGAGYDYVGGKNPRIVIRGEKYAGSKLVKKVRDVLGIGKPGSFKTPAPVAAVAPTQGVSNERTVSQGAAEPAGNAPVPGRGPDGAGPADGTAAAGAQAPASAGQAVVPGRPDALPAGEGPGAAAAPPGPGRAGAAPGGDGNRGPAAPAQPGGGRSPGGREGLAGGQGVGAGPGGVPAVGGPAGTGSAAGEATGGDAGEGGEASPGEGQEAQEPIGRLVETIRGDLSAGKSLNNLWLTKLAEEAFGGTRGEGKYDPRDAYDALEAAVNRHIEEAKLVDFADPENTLKRLEELTARLPRQTDRTREQIEFQQFSTPPAEAFAAVYAAGIKAGMTVIEPSAGTGNLATMARIAGARVLTNEISERRRKLLEALGFPTYNLDAEQLDNLLPEEVQADVVVMNPPFSATGGRTKGHRTEYGANHITQALLRTKEGGRVVAIAGRGMAHDKPAFADWWRGIEKKYDVRANVGMSGKFYGKYGTAFDNQIIVIDKTGPTADVRGIIRGDGLSPTEAVQALSPLAREDVHGRLQTQSQRGPATAVQGPDGGDAGGDAAVPAGPSAAPAAGGQRGGTGTGSAPTQRPGNRGDDGPAAQPATGGRAGGQPGSAAGGTQRPGGTDAGAGGEPGAAGLTRDSAGGAGRGSVSSQPELEEGTPYAKYVVSKARFEGSQPHPANIVESATMAAVQPPDASYSPRLPKEVVQEGRVSDVQIEAVAYMGQATEQIGPDGARREFWLGDGTGVGKGREIGAFIADQIARGRRKHVWVSVDSNKLAVQAQGDLESVGVSLNLLNQSTLKASEKVAAEEGVFFTSYGLLSDDWKKNQRRYKQLLEWLGDPAQFEGVIAFDESHKMKNAATGAFGNAQQALTRAEGTDIGNMGLALKKKFPKARIVNVSATGATAPTNLAYFSRLGLWGPGTAFTDFSQFLDAMRSGGIGAMEQLSRDLKAIGAYISRTISYKGVSYETLEHTLSDGETTIYDDAARLWSELQKEFEKAAQNTGNRRSAQFSQFYSTQQRFFLQLMMSFQTKDMLAAADKALADGQQVVISLFNTNEAHVARQAALAKQQGLEDEEIDFTPRQMLVDLIKRQFPLEQYEDATDPVTGRPIKRPVLDSAGNPVLNRQNLQRQKELIEIVGRLNLPDNPMDAVVNHFGVKQVAEISGRSFRIENGKRVRRKLKGVPSKRINETEQKLFQQGKKKVAVITGAAATGISLHADKSLKNNNRRAFFAMQLSWSADTQMQAFGRVHRSFQTWAPHIVLVQTNVAGQKRLVNTVSRRLASLGALTKGGRETLGGSLFEIEDITDDYGESALENTWGDLTRDQKDRMGVLDSSGNVKDSFRRDVEKFLNRIMVLPVAEQNEVFTTFYDRYQQYVRRAKETGNFDSGIEKIDAKGLKVIEEPQTVYTHPSGARTELVTLEGVVPVPRRTWQSAELLRAGEDGGNYVKQKHSGRVYLVQQSLMGKHRLHSPHSESDHSVEFFDDDKFEQLERDEAKKLWNAELAKIPATRDKQFHVLTGAIFPIYDKVFSANSTIRAKVVEATTKDDRRWLGVTIPQNQLAGLKQRLGIGSSLVKSSAADIFNMVMQGGSAIELDNGWVLRRSRVHGEQRLELEWGSRYPNREELEGFGLFLENIQYKNRWFVPTDEQGGVAALGKLLEAHKAVRDQTSRSADDSGQGPHGGTQNLRAPATSRIQKAGTATPQPGTPAGVGRDAAAWAGEKPQTLRGRGLVQKILRDSEGKKAGLRSIIEFVNNLLNTRMLVGRTQTSKKNPAHYLQQYHIIRSRSGAWTADFHEAGHALAAILEDRAKDSGGSGIAGEALRDLAALPDSYASAQTAEEGMAEWVRRYIVAPSTIPAGLTQRIEANIQRFDAPILAGLRDAHRAFVAHASRDILAQARSYRTDSSGRKASLLETTRDLWHALVYHGVSWRMGIKRLNDRMFRALRQYSIESARQWRKTVKDTPADFDSALGLRSHVPQMVDRALHGSRKLDGIVVHATGSEQFPAADSEILRAAGLNIPAATARHGDLLVLHNRSIAATRRELAGDGDSWDDFVVYGQQRAALHRFDTKGHLYPGIEDTLPPETLRRWIKEQDRKHPKWSGHFKAINRFMDQLLLVPYLSGELDAAAVVRIKTAWEDYWPLPRQVEDRTMRTQGGGADPSAGIHAAFGSRMPFGSFEEALETRVRMAFQSYYENRARLAIHRAGVAMQGMEDVPLELRSEGLRQMLPLKLDTAKVASLAEGEQQKIIADYLNEQKAKELGVKPEELPDDERVAAADVEIAHPGMALFRRVRPRTVNVISTFDGGKRQYWQVPDVLTFRMLALSEHPNEFVRALGVMVRGVVRPWKRLTTQNIAFGSLNVAARDMQTAVESGEDAKSLIPYAQLATGLLNRLTGDKAGVGQLSEQLSFALDQASTRPKETLWHRFLDVLAEDVVIPGWRQLPVLEKALRVPGIAMSGVLKPIEVGLWATGQRKFAESTESLTREGAAADVRRRGGSMESAQAAYDRITGRFGERPGSGTLAEIYRMAGFLNPGLQIIFRQYERLTDVDPRKRLAYGGRIAWLAAISAAAAALNWLLSDDEDRDRLRERPVPGRYHWADVHGLKLPFQPGIVGAVTSWAWNAVESRLLDDPIGADEQAKAVLKNLADMSGPWDATMPHVHTLVELNRNYSDFMGRPIVPDWMQRTYAANPEMQAYPSTPTMYKRIGRLLGVSPLKVQYLLRNVGTYQTHSIMLLVEGEAIEEAADLPFLGRLFTRDPQGWGSRSVQELAEEDASWRGAGQMLAILDEQMATALPAGLTPAEKIAALKEMQGLSEREKARYTAAEAQRDAAAAAHRAMLAVQKLLRQAKEAEARGDKAEADAKGKEATAIAREALGKRP